MADEQVVDAEDTVDATEAAQEAPAVDAVNDDAKPAGDAPATALDASGDDDGEQPTPATWPDDWREKLANGDDKLLKRLGRFRSPDGVMKSWLASDQRINSGELKSALPDDATPEQITAWRADNGIPEKSTDYEVSLPDGMVLGEEDKPAVDAFLESAHAANMSPDQVNQSLAWYYQHKDAVEAEQAQFDETSRIETEESLRAEFGGDYRATLGAIKSFLAGAPDGLGDNLFTARMGDGTLLGNSADALRWLADVSLAVNPMAKILPSTGGDPAKGISDEIATIEKAMRSETGPDGKNDYWRDPAMQARYADLLEARSRAA